MGVVPARLVFLALIGLTGAIIYNALYLQESHGVAISPGGASPEASTGAGSVPTSEIAPPVRTDLPPLPSTQDKPAQLVKAVQRELNARGYVAGPADGELRDDTRKAITAYEKDQNLTVTGSPSDDLLHQLLLGDQ